MALTQPSHVKKRNGRLVVFDYDKLTRSLNVAAQKCCQETSFYAVEIAEAVGLHLAKTFTDKFPSTDDIANAIDTILSSQSWSKVGEEYKNYRLARDNNRNSFKVFKPLQQSLFEADKTVLVTYNQEQRSTNWDRTFIVKALEAEAAVPKAIAQEIARAVEEKVLTAGLSIITTTLIRAITDNELLIRGYTNLLSQRSSITIPFNDIEALLDKDKNIDLAHLIGKEALPAFNLTKKFSDDIAMAHRRAIINISGLKHPNAKFSEAHDLIGSGVTMRQVRARNQAVFSRLATEQLYSVTFKIDEISTKTADLIEEIVDNTANITRSHAIGFEFMASAAKEVMDIFTDIEAVDSVVISLCGNAEDKEILKSCLSKLCQKGWTISWSKNKINSDFKQLISINLPQTLYRSQQHDLDSVINEIFNSIDYAIQAILQSNDYASSHDSKFLLELSGFAEAIQILTGADIFEKFSADACENVILKVIKEKIELAANAYHLNVSLAITPSTLCGKRFAAIDQSLFPELFGYLALEPESLSTLIPPYTPLSLSNDSTDQNFIKKCLKVAEYFPTSFLPITVSDDLDLVFSELIDNKIAFTTFGRYDALENESYFIDNPELPGIY